jgi:FtsP/CotA-like multicopper oxidase with cupredoxin domain
LDRIHILALADIPKQPAMKKASTKNFSRRCFLSHSTLAASAIVTEAAFRFVTSARAQSARPGNPLHLPADWAGDSLTVARANLGIWPGYSTTVSAINGGVPGPTIRVRRGEEFAGRVQNDLAEPLVLHWHGVLAPERMDGHPRDQVAAGESYQVKFPIRQRASTCWYHAHTDQLTAEQAYAGVAGFFIIEDPAEAAFGLPSGKHDVPLVFTDKRVSASRQLVYAPSMMDVMSGYLGDVMLVNGTPDAWLSVDRGLYRLRLLNGSNARIYKVALSDGRPFHLIGTDGGLLPAPVSVTSVMLAPGQRLEVLVDFFAYAAGASVLLKSLQFAGSGGMMGGPRQGTERDLLRFYVDGATTGNAGVPALLRPFTPLASAQAKRTRVFTLAMSGMVHTINGQLFNMQRTDFTVPFGDVEIWEYRNTSTEPHPMHAHAALCQVLSRTSTAALPPEDTGWKDTVLVNPEETVRIVTCFDTHPGTFVHHCHNLEHEDSGMMQNFEVLPPPALVIRRNGASVSLSWPGWEEGWSLESSIEPNGISWEPVTQPPAPLGGQWTVTISELVGRRFYRLVKL